jgi:hypothetical protein
MQPRQFVLRSQKALCCRERIPLQALGHISTVGGDFSTPHVAWADFAHNARSWARHSNGTTGR